MLVSTKKSLEKLQDLLKKEPQPVSMEKATKLFKQSFPNIEDPYRGLSKYKGLYPSYFKGIKFDLITNEGDKVRDYLKRISKDKKEIITSSTKVNKGAKTNLGVSTINAIVKKFNQQNNKQVLLRGGTQFQDSKYDETYKNSKKFKKFYDESYDTPWSKAETYQKTNAYKSFLKRGETKIPSNYALNSEEFMKKLGISSKTTLDSYVSNPDMNSTSRFIKDNFDFKIGATETGAFVKGAGTKQRYWKNLSDTVLRKWKRFTNSRTMTAGMRDNINKLYANEDIQDIIFKSKKLPTLFEVQEALGTKSPSTAANSMALLAKVLKGDEFRIPFEDIPKDVVVGKRILKQIGDIGTRNPYRVAFYQAALANVDQIYKNAGNTTLSSFKDNFRDEMRSLLSLKGKEHIPFSVNEVIGVSTGEMRGLQPYSAFVDVTAKGINEGPLAQYQGRLSKAIGQVQEKLAKGDTAGAEKIASDLGKNVSTYKGFKNLTPDQINKLGLAEIKIGTDIDPKIYSPEQLASYKARGLDIQKLTDQEGFYIDTKGRRPYFEVSTKQLKKVAEKLSKKEQLEVCSLLASGGLPGNCAKAIDENPVKFSKIVSESPATTTAMQKLKTTATGFLGFLKGPGPKTFGIGAGVGAAVGLVKAFSNDDPTTYLSNEDQQKNMLVDMATDPISIDIERPAILDYQLPALGATLAGSTALAAPSTIKASKSRAFGIEKKKPRPGMAKTGLRVLGRGLGIAASPALLAPFAAGDIASQVAEGDSFTDIATDPLNYLYPAFADQTPKLTRGLSPTLQKLARLGLPKLALRGLSRAGIGGFAASAVIQGMDLFDD
tara:strand:+ start:78 stop:2567 length:2490 start_codon:yes stop_codon:yes gene_type:complete